MNFVRSSNGDVVTFRYSPNNQIIFSESVVALTATVVYEGATLVDSVFGAIPNDWKTSDPYITQLILGTSATSIGDYAFSSCTSLSGSLTIPNNVTSIGIGAFRSTPFSSLTLGSGVTSIGSYAFSYCSSLTGPLTIPNSVTSIGDYAFRESGWDGPTAFTYPLTIPGTVSLASYAFNGSSFNGLSVTGTIIIANLFSDKGGIVLGPLTIANTVTSIGSYAFYNNNFTGSLTIPNSVTSIGSFAFAYCAIGSSLTIPNSVTSIGDRAFLGCESITDAYLNQPLSAFDNTFQASGLTTVHLRPSPNTPAGWTIGESQTIAGKDEVTVVADWTTYPDPP